MRTRLTPLGTALICSLLLSWAAPAAVAAAPAPPPSAVAQYVEMIPSSTGAKSPSAEADQATPVARPGAAALAEEPRPVAEVLERVATSPRYGAPTDALPNPSRDRPAPNDPSTAERDAPAFEDGDAESVPPAADAQVDPSFAGAVGDAMWRELGGGRTILVIGLAALAGALLFAARMRTPSRRR